MQDATGKEGDADIGMIIEMLSNNMASSNTLSLNTPLTNLKTANVYTSADKDGFTIRFGNSLKVSSTSTGFTNQLPNDWHVNLDPNDPLFTTIEWTNQNLDWTFQCSYSDDNGSGTKNEKAVNADPMHDIVTIMVLLMVASGIYLAMPVIYTQGILGMYADRTPMYLKALDFIWSLNGFLWGLLFVIAAIVKKHNSYYFMSLMVFLILFSCKKWISDNMGDLYDKSQENTEKIKTKIKELTGRNVEIIPDYPDIINFAGKGNKALSFIECCAFVFFIISAVYAGVDASKFNYFAYTFMGLIIMATGVFNGMPKWEKGKYIGAAFIVLGIIVIAVGCGVQGGANKSLDDIPISSKE
jgi:hypothetical protein